MDTDPDQLVEAVLRVLIPASIASIALMPLVGVESALRPAVIALMPLVGVESALRPAVIALMPLVGVESALRPAVIALMPLVGVESALRPAVIAADLGFWSVCATSVSLVMASY